MNKFVSGAYLMPVLISSGSRIILQDIDILRNKRIKHIDFITVSKTPENNNAVTSTSDLFITLVEKNTQQELIKELSCVFLTRYDNRLFINKIIDFRRSFISGSGLAANQSKYIQLLIWYDYQENWQMIPDVNNRTEINNFEIKLTGSKTFFPDKPELNKSKFQNILLSYPGTLPSGNAGLDSLYAENKFVTLVKNNVEFMYRVPLILFYQTNNNYLLKLQNIQFDLIYSYIETVTTTANDLKSIFFNCIIDDNK